MRRGSRTGAAIIADADVNPTTARPSAPAPDADFSDLAQAPICAA
jgi:hypothetical protein